jgi:hypothetical protein
MSNRLQFTLHNEAAERSNTATEALLHQLHPVTAEAKTLTAV